MAGHTAECLRQPTDVGHDHRDPSSQRLDDDHAVGLGARGQHKEVGRRVGPVEVGADQWSGEPDAVSDPISRRLLAQLVHERRVVGE